MPLDRRSFVKSVAAAGGLALLGRGLVSTIASAQSLGTVDQYGTSRLSRLFPGEFQIHADLHNHSHLSDAAGAPEFFYQRIRAAGLDVAALTDHSTVSRPGSRAPAAENFDTPFCGSEPADGSESACHSLLGIDEEDFVRCGVLADAANEPGTFVGMRGFEWSSPTVGHSNVWFSRTWTDPLETGGLSASSSLQLIADNQPLDELSPLVAEAVTALIVAQQAAGAEGTAGYYQWLNRSPDFPGIGGGSDGIFGFNHPGREPGRFDEFSFEPSLRERNVSIEMFNKGEDYLYENVSAGRTCSLVACLEAGWKPGILGTSDEHDPDWGTALQKGKSGLWVKQLSRLGVREALTARRFSASREKGLRFDAAANGQRMGTTFGHQSGPILFEVDIAQNESALALVDGDRTEPAIGKPGTQLILQVLQRGDPLPSILAQIPVTVPRADQPVIRAEVQVDTAAGRWVLLRLCDPAREYEGPEPERFPQYAAAGRGVVYSSPWYLEPEFAPPVVRQAPGNPATRPSSPGASETATATVAPSPASSEPGSGSGSGSGGGSGAGSGSGSGTGSGSPSGSPSTSASPSPGTRPSTRPSPTAGPGPSATITAATTRLAGASRIETAIEVSRAGFAAGVAQAFVATAGGFADALAAVPAAALVQAPILLTGTDELPDAIRAELARLTPGSIVVLGGPAAVSEAVEAELRAIAPTERLGGADRLETAARISAARFPSGVDEVAIATAGSFPDALSGGPAVARARGPLLLVPPSDDLPEVVVRELARLRPRLITVLGGPTAVGAGVESELRGLAREGVRRLSGRDRIATAAAVAEAVFDAAAEVLVATAGDFPDALTAGPLAAQRMAPVLLVTQTEVPLATDAQLRRLRPERITVVGGTAVISESVAEALRRYETGG